MRTRLAESRVVLLPGDALHIGAFGSGWEFKNAGKAVVPLAGATGLTVHGSRFSGSTVERINFRTRRWFKAQHHGEPGGDGEGAYERFPTYGSRRATGC
jgi:hypothetical protein